ncbi:MAG: carbonic anhydrase [Planctomycetes bacterium]|nr:carbonic anhydrase [Planctomycetota bacterium]
MKLEGRAAEALARLEEGNARFLAQQQAVEICRRPVAQMQDGQEPFAAILSCSDSRVPTEIVFDQGLGDLFVIRVAGNVVSPSQVGSVEFAAARFHTPLVVVLGHSGCGAVAATIDHVLGQDPPETDGLRAIVERIEPAVHPLAELVTDRSELLERAVVANVRASVSRLEHGSALIERLVATTDLAVVGAIYDIPTGRVRFLDH